jgi:hypothetical protein
MSTVHDKDHAWFTPRKSLMFLVRPFYYLFVQLSLRAVFGRPMRLGSCQFYGPPTFLKQCRTAMEELQKLDPDAHLRLTGSVRYTFFFQQTAVIDDRFNGVYSNPKAYVDWGMPGILARLVYAGFMQEMLGRKWPSSRDKLWLKHDAIRIRTQEWLKKEQFPPELIEPMNTSAKD